MVFMIVNALKENEVHVWYAHLSNTVPREHLKYYFSLLGAQERAYYLSLLLDPFKSQYLQTRSFVRLILSSYGLSPPSPQSWRFKTNFYGRPELEESQSKHCPVSFNLSHTDGLIVCIVSKKYEAGVDVEKISNAVEWHSIAQSAFSEKELKGLLEKGPAAVCAEFYKMWTLKEAYIKARGLGLSLPTSQFSMQIDSPYDIRIEYDRHLDVRDQKSWYFQLLNPTSNHQVAIAAYRSGTDEKIRVIQNWLDLHACLMGVINETAISDVAA